MANSVSVLTKFHNSFIHVTFGNVYRNETLIATQKRAQLDLIVLPNYTIYDPNGISAAPTLPETLTAEWWTTLSTADSILAEFEIWLDLVGQLKVLTGVKMTMATTVTCFARLESISDITPVVINGVSKKLRGVFVPITNWADS